MSEHSDNEHPRIYDEAFEGNGSVEQPPAPRGWDKVETSTESTRLAHEEPPQITTAYPMRNHVRIIGKNADGYILEIKSQAHSSNASLICMTRDAARQLMENLFKTLL